MDRNYKISIIVPIYNVEKYVADCIQSLMDQSYRNLEIILIDDGSTDRSGRICEEYGEKDSRIILRHVENGGQSRGRNIGLSIAAGDYVGFVDGDDRVAKTMYEELLTGMLQADAGIGECNFTGRKSREPDVMEEDKEIILSGRDALVKHLDSRSPSRFPSTSVWSKLFRREVIEGLYFPEGRIHEEFLFLCQAMVRCRNYLYFNRRLYYRTLRGDSTTAAAFSLRTFDKLEVYRSRSCYLQELGDQELLSLSRMQEYELMLHYYSLSREAGLKDRAEDLRQEIMELRKDIYRSMLSSGRKLECFLLSVSGDLYYGVRRVLKGRKC